MISARYITLEVQNISIPLRIKRKAGAQPVKATADDAKDTKRPKPKRQVKGNATTGPIPEIGAGTTKATDDGDLP
jgi:hypothetical protein